MFFDGISIVEGSNIANLTVASGAGFPADPSVGELFFKVSDGLYLYDGSTWNRVKDSGSSVDILAGAGLELSGSTLSLQDAVVSVGTYPKVTVDTYGRVTAGTTLSASDIPSLDWSKITSGTPTTLAGYGISDAASSSHVSDATVHLTSGQNTWIDAITVTSAEVNYLAGVTSAVQTQLGNKVDKSGSTMTGNLVMQATKYITLNSSPVNGTDAVNKAYVDSLSTGIVWKNPVNLVNLVGSATSPVGSPGELDAYVIDTGGATGAWAGFAVGDVVQYSTSSGWLKVRDFTIGDRYGVAFVNETTPTGFLASKLLQIATITNATPGAYAATFEVPVVGNAVFIGDPGAALFGRSYTYVEDTSAPIGQPTHNWIQFSGPASTVAGTGLYYSGNTLHVALGAGIAELPTNEVGIEIYPSAGLMTTTDGTASSTATNARLSLTKVGTAGTYTSLTTDAYGRVTAGSNPTTLAGYGITDAATLASPALTGTPTAPTASPGTNTTQIATTAFVAANGAGGLKGATGNGVFFENDQTVTGDYTITSGKNAMSAGPVTIANGITVTVPSGSVWSII